MVDVNNLDESFLMINKTDSAGHQELTPNKYLLESFRTQFIGGLTFGYSYNNQRKNLGVMRPIFGSISRRRAT